MIVMKFGGTSVGNADAFRKVTGIINANLNRSPVIVVSAVAGTTDLLMNSANAVVRKEIKVDDAIKAIREKHDKITEELGLEKSLLDAEFDELKRILDGVCLLQELTKRTVDYVMSFGERMSAKILAGCLCLENKTEAIAYNAWDLGLVTDSEFGDAKPLPESEENVKRSLADAGGRLPVITGFVAKDKDGEITTLGRGGSDFTASLIGAYLRADEIWIWTDVDGILTADPRIVKDAKLIGRLSYNEASELSYFGAKVIHPRTVWPAIEREIPIRIRNTFNPQCEGTIITKDRNANGKIVRAITTIKDLSIINVVGGGMAGVPGIAAKIFSAVSTTGANVLMISQASSENSICFVIHEKDREKVVQQLGTELKGLIEDKTLHKIVPKDDVAIITIVGDGMAGRPGVAAKFCNALAENGISIIAIAQGSSESSISVAINQADVTNAANSVHSDFGLGK